MSEPNASLPRRDDDSPGEPGEALQFDQAEFTTPVSDRPSCTVCQQPIADVYYELGGKVVCSRCRQGVEAAFRGGSPMARVLKALVFGTVAAVAGAAIYYAIIRATHINSALVSILVGFMVGGAIRKGSGNRGGPVYQALAIFLTYSSIVAMHIPLLIEAGLEQARQEETEAKKVLEQLERERVKAKDQTAIAQDAAKPKADATKPSPAPAAGPPGPELAQLPEGKVPAPQDVAVNPRPDQPGPPRSLGDYLVMWAALIGLLYQIPVYLALEHPISGLIYAFALWEAWKINRGVTLAFNGPYRLGTGGVGGPAPEVNDDGE